MIDAGIVYGSEEQAQPVVFGYDTVYVHTEIKPDADHPDIYHYHEKQYTYKEYLQLMEKRMQSDKAFFENALCELDKGGKL